MSDKTNSPDQPPKNDEIDLLILFNNLGSFIVRIVKGFFNIILQIIIFSIRKWLYLTLAIVLGLGLSSLLSKTQQNVYFSDLVLKSNAVENQEIISYINRLSALTSKANYPELARALDISNEDVELISDIKAYWFIDLNRDGIVDLPDLNNRYLADTSTIKVNWKFGVRATVLDPNIFNKLNPGIMHYVQSSDYLVRMNEIRLDMLKEIIGQTAEEVDKLDSLEKKEYFKKEDEIRLREGQLLFTNEPEIKLYYTDLLNLVKEKQTSQRELILHSEIVSVLEDFTITQKPLNDTMFYAKKIVPVFIVLTYFLALLVTFWTNILKAIKKQS